MRHDKHMEHSSLHLPAAANEALVHPPAPSRRKLQQTALQLTHLNFAT